MDIIKELKKLDRYKKFVFLNKTEKFDVLFDKKDYEFVQVHDINFVNPNNIKVGIIGFSGVFEWKHGEITSLDGDSYYKDMDVYGYREVSVDGKTVLDILVKEW